jgi:hypothetical protein
MFGIGFRWRPASSPAQVSFIQVFFIKDAVRAGNNDDDPHQVSNGKYISEESHRPLSARTGGEINPRHITMG